MTEHTALPWDVRADTGEYGTYHLQGDIGGETIGEREDIDQANARFIVTACNCHADLEEAIAQLEERMRELEGEKTLLQAEVEAAGSLLLDVQQDCIQLRKELGQLAVYGARADDC